MAAPIPPDQRARILAELVARRAAGESFEAICATPGFPSRPTIRKWLRRTPGLDVPRLRRPSVRWSPALALRIVLTFGDVSLRGICERPGMPDRTTLAAWRRKQPDFDELLQLVRRAAGQPATGARSTFCPIDAEAVLDAVFETGSIAAACRRTDLPSAYTVRAWARTHPDFALGLHIAYEMAYDRRTDVLLQARTADMEERIAAVKRKLHPPG